MFSTVDIPGARVLAAAEAEITYELPLPGGGTMTAVIPRSKVYDGPVLPGETGRLELEARWARQMLLEGAQKR